jgi:deoxyuridine 5'-triphosphate nucleotidohydrolase
MMSEEKNSTNSNRMDGRMSEINIVPSAPVPSTGSRWNESLNVELMHPDAYDPKRATTYSAGYDLRAFEDFNIPSWGIAKVPLKIRLMVPIGTYGRVAPRSSLALAGITVDAGVIDRDYQGEICVILRNSNDNEYIGYRGDKIAQLILERITLAPTRIVKSIVDIYGMTMRGTGGFGSTDKI